MPETNLLTFLRIASPCHVSWDSMSGSNRVRSCNDCQLNVYNFASMTEGEIRSLIEKSEGRICGRLYRRGDGSILTQDCPVGLRAVRIRVGKVVAAAFATVLSLGSVVLGQSVKHQESSPGQNDVIFERTKAQGQIGDFDGVVLDSNQGRVPGALIELINEVDKSVRTEKSANDGTFRFKEVRDGSYTIKVSAPGFMPLLLTKVELNSNELTRSNIRLMPILREVNMGIVGIAPKIEVPAPIEYRNGTLIIREEAIRKLPILP